MLIVCVRVQQLQRKLYISARALRHLLQRRKLGVLSDYVGDFIGECQYDYCDTYCHY